MVLHVVPTYNFHLSTWSFWVVTLIAILHLSGAMIPAGLLRGSVALGTSVFVGGFVVQLIHSKKANKLNRARSEQLAKVSWYDKLFTPQNVGQHAIPLLILCAALLLRAPGEASYVSKLSWAVSIPVIWWLQTTIQGSNVADSYNITQAESRSMVVILTVFLFLMSTAV